MQPIKINYSL